MKSAPLPKGQSQLEVKATLRTRSLPNDEVKVTFDVEPSAAGFRRYTDWASFILNQHVSGGPAALRWKRCEDVMPDSDETVMVHHPGEDEPVWLGYHDGEVWRYVDGAQCGVTHWIELPAPPRNENDSSSETAEGRRSVARLLRGGSAGSSSRDKRSRPGAVLCSALVLAFA